MKKKVAVLVGVAVLTMAGMSQAATRFAVQDAAGVNDLTVITDLGRIGVGTNAPTTSIQMKGNAATLPQFRGGYVGTTPSGGAGFYGMHNNDAGALPNASDRLGYFWAGSQNGNSYIVGAGFTARAEAAYTATSAPSYLTFETTSANAVFPTERVRINSTGQVGIGVTAPSQKLEVNGGIRLATVTVRPACVAAVRGTLWVSLGTTDTLSICTQTGGAAPSWKTVTIQ